MKLVIGTVQFGLKYGTVFSRKQNTEQESRDILDIAYNSGIKYLDTAYDYGSSEEIIGKISDSRFDIITKTAYDLLTGGVDNLIPNLKESLRRLNSANIFGILIHNAEDLTGKRSDDVFYNLYKAKDMGLVKNIGVSVYNPEEASYITEKYQIDIIQIPYNILDKRFVDMLKELKDKNISIHTRSIFLQGMLLKKPDTLPACLQKAGANIKKIQKVASDNNISVLQLLVDYIKSTNFDLIDKIIIGSHDTEQLKQIITAYNNPVNNNIDFSQFYIDDINIINPRKWRII